MTVYMKKRKIVFKLYTVYGGYASHFYWGQTNGNSAFSKDKQIKMTFKEIFQKTSGYMALV